MTIREAEHNRQLNRTIGAAIREARLARGVTQEELARAFGVDRVTIARYEGGTRTLSAPALIQILSFLGQPLPLGDTQTSMRAGTEGRALQLDPPVARLVHLLQERPDLVATVEDLLETLEVLPPRS